MTTLNQTTRRGSSILAALLILIVVVIVLGGLAGFMAVKVNHAVEQHNQSVQQQIDSLEN